MIKFKLEEVLDKRNMTRYKLSKEAKLDYATVSKICNNNTTAIKLEVLEKIIKFTGCTFDELMEIEDEQ